jgi:DnaA-homolog protein
MPTQFALDLQLKTSFNFDNYIAGDNALCVALLQQAATGNGESQLLIWGAAGCGKSHLLQAVCARASQQQRIASYLPLATLLQHGSELLQGFEQADLICIDDVQCIAGKPEWQEALFHFNNIVRSQHKNLIYAATLPPNELDLQLEDLRSRMNWGPVVQIKTLDDVDKLKALQLRAQARGYELPDVVAQYLLNNFARDLVNLFERLDQLELVSLQQQRKLTVPFVKQVFGE